MSKLQSIRRKGMILAAAGTAALAGTTQAATVTWDGGGADNNWNTGANWVGDVAPVADDALIFAGAVRLTPNNDLTADTQITALTFDATAGTFTLGGNSILLGGDIVNNSSNLQTIALGMSFNANRTIDGGSSGILLSGPLTNTAGSGTQILTLQGLGTITGIHSLTGNGTTQYSPTGAASTWSWLGNQTSVLGDAAIRINDGATFNYGSATDAPNVTFTEASGTSTTDGLETEIGFDGVGGTWNMINGHFIAHDRMNTRGTAIYNQTGGTMEIWDQFQTSNNNLQANATFNVSAGFFDIRNGAGSETTGGTFFLASRGHGTFNLSGTGHVRSGNFDVSRNINNGTTGVVNLNGGVLEVARVTTASANSNIANTLSQGTFNFNGGTLRARLDQADFIRQNSAAGHNAPLTLYVKAGGAIIDSNGFNIGALLPLQHDPALGGTPDGGLTKLGGGTLTFEADNTYTGTTTISNGAIQVGNGGASGSLGTGNIVNSGTSNLVINRTGTLTIPGNISGTQGLDHTNTATVTLSGTNTYAGPTTVSGGGTLVVTGSLLNTGTVTMNNVAGTTLAGTGSLGNVALAAGGSSINVRPGASADDGNVGTLTLASLSVNNADFRMDVNGSDDLVSVTGAVTFETGGASSFTPVFSGTPTAGTSTLVTAGSPITYNHVPTLNAPTQSRLVFNLDTATNPNAIVLSVTGNAANLVWTGAQDTTTWDINTTANWTGIPDQKFFNLDAVTFDNTSVNGNVTLNVPVIPSAVTVNNSTTNYTISGAGSIGGETTALTKSGTGTLTLATANTYGGGTTLSAGTLKIGNAAALGTGPLTMTGGTLDLNGNNLTVGTLNGSSGAVVTDSIGTTPTLTVGGPDDATFAGAINNGVAGLFLTKEGGGTLVLTGTNTYANQTTINAGTLQMGNGGTTGSIVSNIAGAGGTFAINRSNNLVFSNNVSGAVGLRKDGINTVTLTGFNDYTGPTTISGGTLQVGDGGTVGTLGSGAVLNNGILVSNRSDTHTFAGAISGSGSLQKVANGHLVLTGISTYDGTTTISDGIVTAGSGAALGATSGGDVTIASGATLSLGGVAGANAINFGQKVFHIAGTGHNGFGVITNSDLVNDPSGTSGGINQQNAFQRVVLDADASIGNPSLGPDMDPENGRIDIRSGQIGGTLAAPGPYTASLTLNGHNLTKIGNSKLTLVNCDVIGLGNIVVPGTNVNANYAGSTLIFEQDTRVLADGSSKLIFGDQTIMQFWDVDDREDDLDGGDPNNRPTAGTRLTRPVEMGDGLPGSFSYIAAGGGIGTVSMPILLKGNLLVRPTYGNEDNDPLVLTGNITQDATPRKIIKTQAELLTLAGTNSFTGGLEINPGTAFTAGGGGETGTIQLGSAGALHAANVVSFGPTAGFTGVFQLNGFSPTIAGLAGGTAAGGVARVENANATAATLTINNTANHTYSGTIEDGAGGGALSLAKSGIGTQTLSGVNVYAGATTVNAGVLQLAPGATSLIKSGPVTVANNAKIDLIDNKLITSDAAGTWDGVSAYTGVAGLVDAGRGSAGNALWDGTRGITTTDTRAINNGDLVSIGVAKVANVRTVADTETTTFAGQTVLGSDTLVMATWGGDANLDGKINIDDYGRIDGNVGQSGSVFGWDKGDFNYDGKINIDDYGIIDGNINRQGAVFATAGGAGSAALEGVAAVPEPAGLALIALAATSLLARRRRARA